ncbi:hypothetical protein niasHT_033330 [Heterodera trifolii]|uniref:long-chain-fatty-acid--CoA ligase n=1 Tax=Heterodera trifolii TaxID=157864 RepID=A0ABD2I1P8_9BILA
MGLHDEVASLSDVPPSPDDLATICYTSGTTGVPKGVMLTHGNIIADCTALGYFKNTQLNHHDVMFSFLPLAHMFERVMQTAVYCEGGSVGFFRGDIRLLADDIKTLRPTVLPVVPRVLNRIYDKVLVEANKSVFTRLLFDAVVGLKTRELNNWIVRNNSLLDQIVFKKVREGLGGRVKLMITGSAPLSETVLTFMRCATGAVVCEGYGQTECVAAATITIEGDPVPGHVSVPVPCCAVKLIDVPELNYFAKHGAGEVCVKGPNVFRGYYKMAEQTVETLDTDGWLHTGDIGRWTEQGTLKIVDRKKHIFKLAQGEYVAPEKIELIYMRSKYVAQCFVQGESLKTYLVAVVVPDFDVLPEATKKQYGQSDCQGTADTQKAFGPKSVPHAFPSVVHPLPNGCWSVGAIITRSGCWRQQMQRRTTTKQRHTLGTSQWHRMAMHSMRMVVPRKRVKMNNNNNIMVMMMMMIVDGTRPRNISWNWRAMNLPTCAAAPSDEQMARAKTALTDALQRSGSVFEENNQIAFFDLLTAHHLDDIDEEMERAEAKTAVSVNFKELSKLDIEQVRVVHACLAELRNFWHCFPARTPKLEQKFQQCRAQLSLARRRFLAFQNAAATRRPKK